MDIPFSTEGVEHTVNKMKSAGPNNLTAEHLKFEGQTIITWVTEILNSIVDVKQIPACLKLGITILVYKGGGKDPLNANSYRCITLNSVISKYSSTDWNLSSWRLACYILTNQPKGSVYHNYADAIFATHKPISRRGVQVSL
jgi:hypothetical protein